MRGSSDKMTGSYLNLIMPTFLGRATRHPNIFAISVDGDFTCDSATLILPLSP